MRQTASTLASRLPANCNPNRVETPRPVGIYHSCYSSRIISDDNLDGRMRDMRLQLREVELSGLKVGITFLGGLGILTLVKGFEVIISSRTSQDQKALSALR